MKLKTEEITSLKYSDGKNVNYNCFKIGIDLCRSYQIYH